MELLGVSLATAGRLAQERDNFRWSIEAATSPSGGLAILHYITINQSHQKCFDEILNYAYRDDCYYDNQSTGMFRSSSL